MKRFAAAFGLLPLLIGAGCSGPDSRSGPETIDTFTTNITEKNEKFFSYSVEMMMPKMTGRTPPSGPGAGGMGGGGMPPGGMGGGGMPPGGMGGKKMPGEGKLPDAEEMKKRMEERTGQLVALKIEESGFCTKGFTIDDKHMGSGYFQVLGHCKDLATAEDREKFPNAGKPQ